MGSHSIIARWYERILTTWPFPRSVPGEQQEAYLCDKEPVMRRSAAALLARSHNPAPSLPPHPKGLEAVKAAATAAVRAVDAKLAAVRATVAGGRATHQPGSGATAAARHGGLCVAPAPTRSCSTGQQTTPLPPTPLPPSCLFLPTMALPPPRNRGGARRGARPVRPSCRHRRPSDWRRWALRRTRLGLNRQGSSALLW